jgi:hypothetical protein
MTTKITEALAPIGAAAKLYMTAADILRAHQVDVAKALPAFVKELGDAALLSALATNYLDRVAADMRHGARTKTAAIEAEKAETATAPGQTKNEAQRMAAGGHPSKDIVVHARGREGPKRRKMPTEAQRQAEITAAQRTTLFDTWRVRGGHKIGNLYVHELRTRALESVRTGFGFVVRGKDDLVDGVSFQLIALHVQASDPMARVRDVVSEKTLKQIQARAIKLAKKGIDRVNEMPREMLTEIINAESPARVEQQQ